jgi:hypothetical protein
MDKLINQISHQDIAAIKLSLYLDLRSELDTAVLLHNATKARIANKVGEGKGQIFEDGPVFLQSKTRDIPSGTINQSCLYQMDFDNPSLEKCARMHIHPFGERLLVITPVSTFRVWSLTQFEVDTDLEPLLMHLKPYTCTESNRAIYGVEISSGTIFTVHIPAGTTHRFLGSATAMSFHPEESKELKAVKSCLSSMKAQTEFWSKNYPLPSECLII